MKHERLASLDAMRGATIAGMILVNNPGSWSNVYPQLQHAKWNGWTFTDTIFPFFLFIVGVALTFSFRHRVVEGEGRGKLYFHIIRRFAIIFLLGIFLNAFPYFKISTVRIPGVLQRIAVCYLVASLILLNSGIKAQVYWTVGLLGAYWLMVKLIPVPGYGAGLIQPTGNLAWYIDSHVFAGHTYAYAPAPGFDPEGILSTLPAVATTLFGALTGQWMQSERTKEVKTVWMLVVGNILIFVGAVLDMWLPINKNMWTSSYSIFMAGMALVCLGIFYWFIDVMGYRKWAVPFIIYGMNPIAVYFLSEIISTLLGVISWRTSDGVEVSLQSQIYHAIFSPLACPVNASLLYSISFILFMFFIAWFMWRRRWFLKI